MIEGIAYPNQTICIDDQYEWWKITKKNTIKTREKKAKLNTKALDVGQKGRVSNCIHILYHSIFVKIEPLNKYSKDVKSKYGFQR